MADMTYRENGIFISFFPETKLGEDLWREMAAHSEGSCTFFSQHKASILDQLRKAGAIVRKAKKTKINIEEIFAEMDELGI